MNTQRWCMISQQTAITNVALDWIRAQVSSSRVLVDHDRENYLFVEVPPDALLAGLEERLEYNPLLADDPAAQLQAHMLQVVTFMLSDSANILTGDWRIFDNLYKTPHHRIWRIANPDSEGATQYASDYLAVFGQAVGNVTPIQASAAIKQYFENL